MDWTAWRNHFEENARRPLPRIAADAPPQWRGVLVHSLARFQIGEVGEGSIAHRIYRVSLPHIDDDYRIAVGLFVREEGRHARVLAEMVRALGGELLRHTWTRRLFGVRRLAGVRFKLLVLLAAEVIGIGFYSMIAGALPPGKMRAALEEIAGDEDFHLRFHCDFFRPMCSGAPARWAFRAGWWPVASAAALAVLWDHRRTLDALGIGRAAAARRLFALVARADRAITAPARPRSFAAPAVS